MLNIHFFSGLTMKAVALFILAFAQLACSGDEPTLPASMPPVPVKTERLFVQQWHDERSVTAVAAAAESVEITSSVSEKVKAIHFNEVQAVEAGDLLVSLESDAEQAEREAAYGSLQEREQALVRAGALRQQGHLSDSQWETLQAEINSARAMWAVWDQAVREREIRAPVSGVLGFREVSVGSLVKPGDVITQLHDLSKLKLSFSVPAQWWAAWADEPTVDVSLPQEMGRVIRGEGLQWAAYVDPQTRRVPGQVWLANPERTLLPGMLFNVSLKSGVRQSLLVPEVAVQVNGDQHYAMIVVEGKASKKEIQIGSRRNGLVEVLAGLKVGDELIVHGAHKVRSGQSITHSKN